MIGERKEINQQNYGTLVMRPYDIAGNSINAFYDASDDLVFVLDNTINEQKPNVLLVINPDADKKWDEILSRDYNVDLETVRPKQDNKYQKLDIEYSGLGVYDNLIRAYLAGDDMQDSLVQLSVLRDSAARHSAMMRLDVANDIIAKTNTTIVKTKETIVRLQTRIKTLREKLSATKKEIGKVPTKQSASKVLRLESQIEASNEKLKRAKKRLESAQRRLETATVDAELASNLLNQPPLEIENLNKTEKSVIVAPKHELETVKQNDVVPVVNATDDEDNIDEEDVDEEDNKGEVQDNDIKPLFEKDPDILNEDIAFKPISFDVPVVNEEKEEQNIPVLNDEFFTETTETTESTETTENLPVTENFEAPVSTIEEEKPIFESFEPVVPSTEEKEIEQKPVLETMTPVVQEETVVEDIQEPVAPVVSTVPPVSPVPSVRPVAPVVKQEPAVAVKAADEKSGTKPTIIYYVLLFILIVLSIFTLWVYQKNMKNSTPVLTATTEETTVVEKQPAPEKSVVQDIKPVEEDAVFVDEVVEQDDSVATKEPVVEQPVEEISEPIPEPIVEPAVEDVMPEVIDAVPARVVSSGPAQEDVVPVVVAEEVVVNKPVYEPGSKHDDMFVSEQSVNQPENVDVPEFIVEPDFVDDTEPVTQTDVVHEDTDFVDQFYDEEEAAYMAGDTGYEE